MLSAAQFTLPVELAAMQLGSESVQVLAELKAFQEAIGKFQAMNVDTTEFACLRAIVLLKTSAESSSSADSREVRDQAAVTALQVVNSSAPRRCLSKRFCVRVRVKVTEKKMITYQ